MNLKGKKGAKEETKEETKEDFETFMGNQNFVHLVYCGDIPKLGVELFAVKLEYEYFPPGTDISNDFYLRVVEWMGLDWAIISIPKTEIDLAEKVAFECGLMLINKIMIGISSKGIQDFPAYNERVFSLENIPGHISSTGKPKIIQKLFNMEEKEIKRIIAEAKQRKPKITKK